MEGEILAGGAGGVLGAVVGKEREAVKIWMIQHNLKDSLSKEEAFACGITICKIFFVISWPKSVYHSINQSIIVFQKCVFEYLHYLVHIRSSHF